MDGTPTRRLVVSRAPRAAAPRRAALCVAVCWLALGCRNDPYLDAHIELQNAAKRSLEDQLYDLQFDYQAKAKEVERLRAENEKLRGRGAAPRAESSDVPAIEPPQIELPDNPPQATPPAQPAPEEDMGPLQPPTVEPGVPTDPPAVNPSTPLSPPPAAPASSPRKTSLGGAAPTLDASDPRVARVHINGDLTGLRDWDGKPGEDGLVVFLEPRNQDGKYLPLAGPISVVVLDPREPGERKRLARWDFDATEVDRRMRQSDSSQGIQLQLPWPNQQLQRPRVQLHVRYVTADGRKLEDSQEVAAQASPQLSDRWTPRPKTTATAPPEEKPALDVARPEWKPYR